MSGLTQCKARQGKEGIISHCCTDFLKQFSATSFCLHPWSEVLTPPLSPPLVNIQTACRFSCLLNPIIWSERTIIKGIMKRRLFPKVLYVTFFYLLLYAPLHCHIDTLLSQSKGSAVWDWTSTELTWKMPRWGEWKTHKQGDREGWRSGERSRDVRNGNVTVDGFNAGHWPCFSMFLIRPIFRANLP